MRERLILPDLMEKVEDSERGYPEVARILLDTELTAYMLQGIHRTIPQCRPIAICLDEVHNGSYDCDKERLDDFRLVYDVTFESFVEKKRRNAWLGELKKTLFEIGWNRKYAKEFQKLLSSHYKKLSDQSRLVKARCLAFQPSVSCCKYREVPDDLDIVFMDDLAELMEVLTEKGFQVIEALKPGDFLFENNGTIAYFTGFCKVSRRGITKAELNEKNQVKFYESMEAFGKERPHVFTKEAFDAVYGRMGNSIRYGSKNLVVAGMKRSYKNFKELRRHVSAGDRKGDRCTVGVFLDWANLFFGLEHFDVDISRILYDVIGSKGRLEEGHSFASLFRPCLGSERAQEFADNRFEIARRHLLSHDIRVFEAANGKPEAKEIINGEEWDVDDRLLIEEIRKRFNGYDLICIGSGDGHFAEVAEEVRGHGKEVVILAPDPESSAFDPGVWEVKYMKEYVEYMDLKIRKEMGFCD